MSVGPADGRIAELTVLDWRPGSGQTAQRLNGTLASRDRTLRHVSRYPSGCSLRVTEEGYTASSDRSARPAPDLSMWHPASFGKICQSRGQPRGLFRGPVLRL